MTFEIAAVAVAIVLGLLLLEEFFARRREARDAEYLRDNLGECANDVSLLNGLLKDEQRRGDNIAVAAGDLQRENERVGSLLAKADAEIDVADSDLNDALDALGDAEEEADEADDLLEKADELLLQSAALLEETEQELTYAESRATSAANRALRLAAKLDSLGIMMTNEEIIEWRG